MREPLTSQLLFSTWKDFISGYGWMDGWTVCRSDGWSAKITGSLIVRSRPNASDPLCRWKVMLTVFGSCSDLWWIVWRGKTDLIMSSAWVTQSTHHPSIHGRSALSTGWMEVHNPRWSGKPGGHKRTSRNFLIDQKHVGFMESFSTQEFSVISKL